MDGFTKKYNIGRLVYYEWTGSALGAIEREKQIKAWRRAKKIALLTKMNPTWRDLSKDFDGEAQDSSRVVSDMSFRAASPAYQRASPPTLRRPESSRKRLARNLS
jgi:hypothetical protein